MRWHAKAYSGCGVDQAGELGCSPADVGGKGKYCYDNTNDFGEGVLIFFF